MNAHMWESPGCHRAGAGGAAYTNCVLVAGTPHTAAVVLTLLSHEQRQCYSLGHPARSGLCLAPASLQHKLTKITESGSNVESVAIHGTAKCKMPPTIGNTSSKFGTDCAQGYLFGSHSYNMGVLLALFLKSCVPDCVLSPYQYQAL